MLPMPASPDRMTPWAWGWCIRRPQVPRKARLQRGSERISWFSWKGFDRITANLSGIATRPEGSSFAAAHRVDLLDDVVGLVHQRLLPAEGLLNLAVDRLDAGRSCVGL